MPTTTPTMIVTSPALTAGQVVSVAPQATETPAAKTVDAVKPPAATTTVAPTATDPPAKLGPHRNVREIPTVTAGAAASTAPPVNTTATQQDAGLVIDYGGRN
jgi:hypothetical protein